MGQNYFEIPACAGLPSLLIMVVVGIYAVLIQQIGTADDISGAIWGCMGYTVLALLLSVQDRQHIESRFYRTLTDRRNTNHQRNTKETYNILYADPPWRYEQKAVQGAAEKHYPTMSIDEPVRPAGGNAGGKDCLLFCGQLSPAPGGAASD